MTFTVGDVMNRSLRILFANLLPFLVLATVVLLPVLAVNLFFVSSLLHTDPRENPAIMFLPLASVLIQQVLSLLLAGAFTYGVFQQMRGRPASMSTCVVVGLRRLLPVLGVAFGAGTLVILGCLALIVPGLVLMSMWWVAVPAAVIENAGVGDAMRRSALLTFGHRMTIFLIIVILLVLATLAGTIGDRVLSSVNLYASVVVVFLFNVFFTAWSSVANAVAYHDLRVMKEHVGIEDLAAVFD